jgi:hypothetical protein
MGIIKTTNRMQESNEDHGVDMEAIRRMAEGQTLKPLQATPSGKLRVAPTKAEQAMEEAQDRINREIAGLAKQIAETEDYAIKKAVRKCVPSSIWKRCLAEMDRGNTFAMRKMMNEYDLKLQVVEHPEMMDADDAAGITRRHLRLSKAGVVVWEHVWEWSRA